MPIVVVGVLAALATTAAIMSTQLFKRKSENEQRKTDHIELESKEKTERILDDAVTMVNKIEEIRYSLTEGKTRNAGRYADQAEYLAESLDEAKGNITLQLAKIRANYHVLLEAGNVRELSDGTHEVIDLSGLNESQEQVVRLAIEQDNAYITKSHNVMNVIARLTVKVNEIRDDLTVTANSSAQDLLQQNKAPEGLYQEALTEIVETYQPEEDENPDRRPTPIESGPPERQLGTGEGSLEPTIQETSEGETSSAPESVYGSPSVRLLELAKKAQTSVPKETHKEIGLGD
ncbi:hypothetical protein [Nocardiopsis prasina]|uniref:hypothetical protein n=1 Tax=Nocardiopsis prasina TaxID=2015 RepID=UPI00036ED4D4|nr:hypothetical protein [Nocardiopsis prasina]